MTNKQKRIRYKANCRARKEPPIPKNTLCISLLTTEGLKKIVTKDRMFQSYINYLIHINNGR